MLVLDCDGPRVAIVVLTERLIRVRLAPGGQFAPRRSWDVARADDEFPSVPFSVEERGGEIVLSTAALTVHIERATGRLAFSDPHTRVFAADAEAMAWLETGPVRISKRIAGGEHFYGFGERTGWLEKSGRHFVNWAVDTAHPHGPDVNAMYIPIPIYLSLRPGRSENAREALAYGLFFHNTFRSTIDVGRLETDVVTLQAEGGEADYYLAYGPTPADVMRAWAALLGTTPLPPRWALGHHQSRWGYKLADEIRDLAAMFRNVDIPCDVFHLDIDYMHGYRVFTWDPERFPDPAALAAELRRDGFRLVTIIDPGVKADPDYRVYQEGLERDYFIRDARGEVAHGYVWPDDSVFADFMRPEVRAWWGETLQKELTTRGVSGVWSDMNEPVVFDRAFSQGGTGADTLPLDAPQGPEGERTTHAEVHNLYGWNMARASYEGLRKLLGDERPFTLTRSGFAGIQRWAACWMGDNESWWEHLEMALPQLCNMGLSGVPFVGVDIGGFSDNCTGELLARWSQIGALMPFCRNHSAAGTARQEPWAFGPEIQAIYRQAMKLRYRLLPYLYSLFWEAAQTGAPVWRPLLYEFPNDPATYTLHDQILLGPSLMAAPILRPGQTHRAVYLPEGEWYDWHSGACFHGPTHLLAHAPLERMPLYVRAGSLIPLGPDVRYADERPLDPLTLLLVPGRGAFTLYEDDGHSFAYERGEWCTTRYELQRGTRMLTLKRAAREGAYTPPRHQLVIQVLGGESVTLDDDGQARAIDLKLP